MVSSQLREKTFDTNKDSLVKVINSSVHDSVKLYAYYELGSLTIADSLEQGSEYLLAGVSIAKKIRNYKTLALLYQRQGSGFITRNRYNEAITYFDSSLQVYLKNVPDNPAIVTLYNNYAVAYYMLEDNRAALALYLKGYEFCKKHPPVKSYPNIVNNIGLLYKKLEQYPEALTFLQESVQVKKQLKDTIGEANSLFNIGTIYVETKKSDSAVKYLSEAQKMYRRLNATDDINSVDLVLAALYYKTDNPGKAYTLLAPFARDDFKTIEDRNKTTPLLVLAGIHLKNKNISAAHKWLKNIEKIERDFITDKELKDYYQLNAEAYAASGNYKKSYAYADSVITLQSKIDEEKTGRITQEMLAKLQTREKEARIELLEAENLIKELQLSNNKKQNRLLITGTAILACLTIVFWRLGQKIKRQKNLIEQNIAGREKIITMKFMIEGQHAERTRIAKDLHDGLGGLLSTVKSYFSKIEPDTANHNPELYNKVNQLIDEACIEVRKISHNMMPHALSIAGLRGALEDLKFYIIGSGLVCKMETSGQMEHLPENTSTMLYRIIQELVQNIIKHAQATEVFIQVLYLKGTMHITIEDNGRGFDLEHPYTHKGMGIENVRSRVNYLNGTVMFDTVAGKGTTVNIEIPIP